MDDIERKIIDEFGEEQMAKTVEHRDRYVPLAWKRILKLLKDEIVEYEEARTKSDKQREAVDIGNYAMYLWWHTKQ